MIAIVPIHTCMACANGLIRTLEPEQLLATTRHSALRMVRRRDLLASWGEAILYSGTTMGCCRASLIASESQISCRTDASVGLAFFSVKMDQPRFIVRMLISKGQTIVVTPHHDWFILAVLCREHDRLRGTARPKRREEQRRLDRYHWLGAGVWRRPVACKINCCGVIAWTRPSRIPLIRIRTRAQPKSSGSASVFLRFLLVHVPVVSPTYLPASSCLLPESYKTTTTSFAPFFAILGSFRAYCESLPPITQEQSVRNCPAAS